MSSSSAIVQSGASAKAAGEAEDPQLQQALAASLAEAQKKKKDKKGKQAFMASVRSSNPAMDILRINHFAPELDISINAETLLLVSGPVKVEED